MATNSTPTVGNDESPRSNKRIKLIQSEVEAAASKASQDFYITSLTENYNKQLEAMEQDHAEHIQEIQELKSQLVACAKQTREDCKTKENDAVVIESLKSQLAASGEKETEDRVRERKETEAAETNRRELEAMERANKRQIQVIKNLELQLAASAERKMIEDRETERKVTDAAKVATASKTRAISLETDLAQSRREGVAFRERAASVEITLRDLRRSRGDELRPQLDAAKKAYEAKLKNLLEDKNGWIQIGFKKMWVTAVSSKLSFAVKRRSSTFLELAKMGVKSPLVTGRNFEYKGRKITEADYNKTLSQVSGVLLETRHYGRLTNSCVLAWF
jgi:hypothetical protein